LSLFAAWVFGSAFSEHVRALLFGPPVFVAPELVTIAAPASGSLVVVTSPAAVLDNADSATSVRAENITSGATGSWVAYHPSKPISPSVIASAGDLIGLTARNGIEAASAEIGDTLAGTPQVLSSVQVAASKSYPFAGEIRDRTRFTGLRTWRDHRCSRLRR